MILSWLAFPLVFFIPTNKTDVLSVIQAKIQNHFLFLFLFQHLSCQLLQVLHFWHSFGFSFSVFQELPNWSLFLMALFQSFLCMTYINLLKQRPWYYLLTTSQKHSVLCHYLVNYMQISVKTLAKKWPLLFHFPFISINIQWNGQSRVLFHKARLAFKSWCFS